MDEMLTTEMAMMMIFVMSIIAVCAILGQIFYFEWRDSSKKRTGAKSGRLDS